MPEQKMERLEALIDDEATASIEQLLRHYRVWKLPVSLPSYHAKSKITLRKLCNRLMLRMLSSGYRMSKRQRLLSGWDPTRRSAIVHELPSNEQADLVG